MAEDFASGNLPHNALTAGEYNTTYPETFSKKRDQNKLVPTLASHSEVSNDDRRQVTFANSNLINPVPTRDKSKQITGGGGVSPPICLWDSQNETNLLQP